MTRHRSGTTYLALLGVLVAVRLLFAVVPVEYAVPGQRALFSWPAVLATAALGAAGVAVARRTGFPDPWDGGVTTRQRLLVPAAVGTGAGVLVVALDLVLGLSIPHVPPPASVPYYAYAAVMNETLFRLFLLPVCLWPASRLPGLAGRRGFWAAALLVSLLEPAGLLPTLAHLGTLAALPLGLVLALNLETAVLFRRYGFLAAVATRGAFYLVWHVAFGGLG